MNYKPLVTTDGVEPKSVRDLEIEVMAASCTHVEDSSGTKWRFFPWLNKKSVPINDASQHNPQRIPWKNVKSFGVMEAYE